MGGSLLVGEWEIHQEIGRGAFATVYSGFHTRTRQQVAVKEINTDKLNSKLKQSLESEVSILRRIAHQNIVQLYDVLERKGRMYLIMEYCAGGDLAGYIRQHIEANERQGTHGISEAAARVLMLQLAAGLRAMWNLNLVHRDLKPQNLLLSCKGPGAVLKIADFGFARNLQPQGLAVTMCGSPLYMAPEILQNRQYDSKADLWSVGTILFELLVGRPPFNAPNHWILVRQIQSQDVQVPEGLAESLSPHCISLITCLLRKNPVERISFEEFFNHPFLASGGIARVLSSSRPSISMDSSISSTHSLQMMSCDRPPLPHTRGDRGGASDASSGRPRSLEGPASYGMDAWGAMGRARAADEAQQSSGAAGLPRIRATLANAPGSRFSQLYGSPGATLLGARATDRASSLPIRLQPAPAPQHEDEDEDYVIIAHEPTPSPSVSTGSSHGSSFRGSSTTSVGTSNNSMAQARYTRPQLQPASSFPSRAHPPTSVPSPGVTPASQASTHIVRAQTMPLRGSPAEAGFSGGGWGTTGGVNRLEGLRQVCHAMEGLAITATMPGGGGPRSALVLRLMALQVLTVAGEEALAGPKCALALIHSDMQTITSRADQVAKQLVRDEDGILPDVWDLVYRGALSLAREAGSKEYIADFGSSRKLYMRAGALLYFMLAEAPNLALNPPLELRGDTRRLLHQYAAAIHQRHAACSAVIEAAAQQLHASGSGSTRPS